MNAEDDKIESDRQESVAERTAAYKKAVENATERFANAVKELFDAVRQMSWHEGWTRGFDRGWESATKYLREQVEKEKEATAVKLQNHFLTSRNSADDSVTFNEAWSAVIKRAPGANEIIYDFVAANPGQRGIEIVKEHRNALLERTVRTALHRLKKTGRIRIVDGRWYASEAAPTIPQKSQARRRPKMEPPK